MPYLEIYRSLRRDYRVSEKRKSDAAFLLYPIYRACSFPLAALFIRLRLSANQVTCVGVFVFVLSFAVLVSGVANPVPLGVGLYVTSFLIDFADGTVARYHGKPNSFGKLIDGFADSVSFAIFIAIAVANLKVGQNLFPAELEIAMGTAATVAALLMQNYEFRVMYLLREAGLTGVKGETHSAARQGLGQLINAVYRNSVTATPLLLIVFAPFQLLSVVLVIFCLLHIGMGMPKVLLGILTVRRRLMSVHRAT